MRESGINNKLTELGYPNLINSDILNELSENTHPLSNMPYYNKGSEPDLLRPEEIAIDRYTELMDSYCSTYDVDKDKVRPYDVMVNATMSNMIAMGKEKDKRVELCILAEKIIREEWCLGADEVVFDLELLDHGNIELPEEINIESPLSEEDKLDVETDMSEEIIKRKTINGLSQGASLKGHYIFHLYQDDIHKIVPEVSNYYQKALIANDLIYYLSSDKEFKDNVESDNSNNAGYVDLDFSGDIPKIIVKAINLPILIHEMIKGIMSLFSVVGIPEENGKKLIDYTDTIMNELWDIRLFPVMWSNLNSMFDERDYDIKKLVLIDLFKKEANEFIYFMKMLDNNSGLAKKEIDSIIKKKRGDIMEYEFNDSIDDIDLSDLGL